MSAFAKIGRGYRRKMAVFNGKSASMLNQVIIQLILIALIFALFLMATADKINGRGVKQQVLEKQIALLIDSAVPGMDFEIVKGNVNGIIQSVKLENGKVFVIVDGLGSFNGYPYFTKYSVSVREETDRFIVSVR